MKEGRKEGGREMEEMKVMQEAWKLRRERVVEIRGGERARKREREKEGGRERIQ